MKKTTTFKKYSVFYDKIYRDKNYKEEADFVDKAIKKYAGNDARTVLSLGCGTCNHDILLAKQGYKITGVDISEEMLAIAREKITREGLKKNIELVHSDITRMSVRKEHDVSIAMFNVFGYLVKNKEIDSTLANVARGLKKGGLFMFDCWYQPAVLKDTPTDKIKEVVIRKDRLIRLTSSILEINKNLIKISFKSLRIRENKIIEEVEETHPMRYWSLPELRYIFEKNKFKLIKVCNFLDINSEISEDNWNIFIMVQKKR